MLTGDSEHYLFYLLAGDTVAVLSSVKGLLLHLYWTSYAMFPYSAPPYNSADSYFHLHQEGNYCRNSCQDLEQLCVESERLIMCVKTEGDIWQTIAEKRECMDYFCRLCVWIVMLKFILHCLIFKCSICN